jgi:hypothetical protein
MKKIIAILLVTIMIGGLVLATEQPPVAVTDRVMETSSNSRYRSL